MMMVMRTFFLSSCRKRPFHSPPFSFSITYQEDLQNNVGNPQMLLMAHLHRMANKGIFAWILTTPRLSSSSPLFSSFFNTIKMVLPSIKSGFRFDFVLNVVATMLCLFIYINHVSANLLRFLFRFLKE